MTKISSTFASHTHNDNLLFSFWADLGGTFLDLLVQTPDNTLVTRKILSKNTDPDFDPLSFGIKQVFKELGSKYIPGFEYIESAPINSKYIKFIKMGTTLGTNSLLESSGGKTVLIVSKGFEDVLEIGTQQRHNLFDLEIVKTSPICSVYEISERQTISTSTRYIPDLVSGDSSSLISKSLAKGINPESLQNIPDQQQLQISTEQILIPNEQETVKIFKNLKSQGFSNVGISFVHSHINSHSEQLVASYAKKAGFKNISSSSSLVTNQGYLSRCQTTALDALISPVLKNYFSNLVTKFDSNDIASKIFCMSSAGTLVPYPYFNGSISILSGPAGGVLGCGIPIFQQLSTPIIGIDSGGTSSDVWRYDGDLDIVQQHKIENMELNSQHLNIHTVASGGGSIISFSNGFLRVGPQSAGSYPGPACYGFSGSKFDQNHSESTQSVPTPTLTDAQLILGRLLPQEFPSTFGPQRNEPISIEKSLESFSIKFKSSSSNISMDIMEIAQGALSVAASSMMRTIKQVTSTRGFKTEDHVLASFGGSGAQIATILADMLNISRIVVPTHASILSAKGIGLAPISLNVAKFIQQDILNVNLISIVRDLYREAKFRWLSESWPSINSDDNDSVTLTTQFSTSFEISYKGTETKLLIDIPSTDFADLADDNINSTEDTPSMLAQNEKLSSSLIQRFLAKYTDQFGFLLSQDTPILINRCFLNLFSPCEFEPLISPLPSSTTISYYTTSHTFDSQLGWRLCEKTPVVHIENLESISGPALCITPHTTIVVDSGWTASSTSYGVSLVKIPVPINITESTFTPDTDQTSGQNTVQNTSQNKFNSSSTRSIQDLLESPIQLSIFFNRFMLIAESMGKMLSQTATSINIRERLDFSCAIFNKLGELVSNAPHIPIHLGAMEFAVKYQIQNFKFSKGDVVLSNHPMAGGSHLPDITVISPIFLNGDSESGPVFFVASRGHHADIGGKSPGSMPPFSSFLSEEGAATLCLHIVEKGQFQEDRIVSWLTEAKTRNLSDNLSDIKAQIAANRKGEQLLINLVESVGLETVYAFMQKLASYSSDLVLPILSRSFTPTYIYMDDGSKLSLSIYPKKSPKSQLTSQGLHGLQETKFCFDFMDTSCQVFGNINTPVAVVTSAVIYALRCLISFSSDSGKSTEIPLNSGLLSNIEFLLPKNSILNPSPEAAVVGGNVLTSQKVADLVFQTFGILANSQGCMNNIVIATGDGKNSNQQCITHYETIGGGMGASSRSNGASALHVHMTNTRITDVEALEMKFPNLLVQRFSRRHNSGGDGEYIGGDGIIREFKVKTGKLFFTLLTESRVFPPHGLCGGSDGSLGKNTLWRNGVPYNLGGKAEITAQSGDIIRIETPGGGGYGSPVES